MLITCGVFASSQILAISSTGSQARGAKQEVVVITAATREEYWERREVREVREVVTRSPTRVVDTTTGVRPAEMIDFRQDF